MRLLDQFVKMIMPDTVRRESAFLSQQKEARSRQDERWREIVSFLGDKPHLPTSSNGAQTQCR
jgi:hypothetical protein